MKRFMGATITVVGAGSLIAGVWTWVLLQNSSLTLACSILGGALVVLGIAIDWWIVRRRISKRGYFEW